MDEMILGDAFKEMMKTRGMNQSWVTKKMGYKSSSALWSIIAKNNTTVDTLLRVCDILDYDIVLQPKRMRGRKAEGQIVIVGKEK